MNNVNNLLFLLLAARETAGPVRKWGKPAAPEQHFDRVDFLSLREINEQVQEQLMDVFSLTFPFQINCVTLLRFSSCCSIFHKLATGRNVTVHLSWWILIGSNDPADRTAVRSRWHHPLSASPWWHIDSSSERGGGSVTRQTFGGLS